MCESTNKSAKRADSGRKRTIRYEQTYKLLKSNISSLIVGFDQIDGSHNKDNKLNI